MRKGMLAIVLILAGALGWISPVFADDIIVYFTAIVDSVIDPRMYIGHLIEDGEFLTGNYIYESNAVDMDPSPYRGDYRYTTNPYGITIYSDNLVFGTDPDSISFGIIIEDSVISGGLHDAYIIWSNSNRKVIGLPDDLIYSELRDNTATALSSDALPTIAPILNDWPNRNLLIIYGPDFIYEIRAHFISMSCLAGIPALSEWSLLFFAILLLIVGAYLVYKMRVMH